MNMELALREVLSAVVADWSADEHHDVPVALIDQARALLAGPVVPWRPTPAAINALPEPLRRYVHDLETRCDPAGDVQRIASLEEQVGGLTRLAEEHQAARVAAERERDDYARSLHTFVRDSGGRSPSKVLEELQTAEARAVAAERDAEEAGEGLVIVTQQLEDTDARLAALEAERDALRGALEAVAKAARTLSEAMDAFYETEVAGDGWVNPERAWARYAELEVLHDALDAALAPRPAAPEGR